MSHETSQERDSDLSEQRATEPSTRGRLPVSIAILFAAGAGNAGIALMPMLLSGMAQFLHFGDAQLGRYASAAALGSALTSIAAVFLFDRPNWPLRTTVIAALVLYVIVNAVTPALFDNPALLAAAMFVGGCCSGISFSAASVALTTVRDNERLVSIFYGVPYLVGLAVPPFLPALFARWGFGAVFFGLAAASLIALVPIVAFPKAVSQARARFDRERTLPVPGRRTGQFVLIVLLALFVQYAANSGLWVYFDRLGRLAGHGAQASANAVALGAAFALVGTVLATVLTTRLRPATAIGAVSIVMAIVCLGFLNARSYFVFAGSVAIFNAMITLVTPFFFLLLSKMAASPSRAVLGANISMMGGFALGPMIVGWMVGSGGFSVPIIATAPAFVLSGLLVLIGSRMQSVRNA